MKTIKTNVHFYSSRAILDNTQVVQGIPHMWVSDLPHLGTDGTTAAGLIAVGKEKGERRKKTNLNATQHSRNENLFFSHAQGKAGPFGFLAVNARSKQCILYVGKEDKTVGKK